MTSEIKVDTISEQTSGSGVTIDGVLIKDTTIDVNGTAGALILDTDADTKIQASTDDNIEFFTAGKKQFNLTNSGSVQAFRDGGTTFGPSYLGQHQRGTIASPSIVQSGDRLVEFKSTAYDGTAYIDGPRISFRVDGTPGDDDMPSRIEFQTVPDGSNALAERMRITSDGRVAIGTTSPQTTLHLEATAPILRISDSNSTSEDDAVSKIQFYDRNNTDLNAEIIAGDGSLSNLILSAHNNRAVIAQTNGNNERFRVHGDGTLSTGGETVTDVNVGGLTLQMNAGDGGFMTGKSSDVAHGMTNIAETDTFFRLAKENDTGGGVELRGLSETDDAGITLDGIVVNRDSGTNTSAKAPVSINARKKNGTTTQSMDDVDNMLVVRDSGTTRFIVKGDGELHNDQTATVGTFDTYEDAQLVRAYDLTHGKGVINSKFDDFIKYNHEDLAKANLVGREPDGTPNHFVNITGFQRLHNGAIWQQYEKHQRLAEAVYEMAKETLGADKADAILKKHDIKLLN
jgi:hypothetical protein